MLGQTQFKPWHCIYFPYTLDTEDPQNVISIAIGSGENEISKLKLEITRKDLEYKGLQAKCYLLSVSFEQMTNKIGIAEQNFQKSAKTIDAQNKEIEALKVNFENVEVENSRLKAQNESPNNAEENIAAPTDTSSDSRKLLEDNVALKTKLSETESNTEKLTGEKEALEKNIAELNVENQRMKENEQSGTPSQNQDLIKYKEFLKRAQDEYKNLQNEHKKENEKQTAEIEKISLKRLETEERYGQVVKEKEL